MKKNNYTEIIIFTLFCIGTITISCFHEPWFDEFQAWGISKDSIYNILFVIPHLEGHPPLWHLVLKCFSYFNVNCELGLKIPNLLFMFAAVWLLIFKSPFPLIVRITLPFTYFIFYQYSIVNRCYSIFSFAIFLAALFYKDKDEHPFRFVFALALLCLSCAYGMVLAVGIIIVWVIELIKSNKILYKENIERADDKNQVSSKTFFGFIYNFIKDKRFYLIIFIFLFCLYLLSLLYPVPEIKLWPLFKLRTFKTFLYCLFILPSDTLFTDFVNYTNSFLGFRVDYKEYLLGSFLNIFFICTFKYYRKLLLFLLPYIMFVSILALVHFSCHHIGCLFIFYIFVFWCAISDGLNSKNQIPSLWGKSKFIRFLIAFIIFITITIQIYWSITASINEVRYSYSYGREIAQLIKKYNLDKYKIMNNDLFSPVVIISYFNRNIFYSFNINHPNKQYAFLKFMTEEEIQNAKLKLIEEGLPDIIFNTDSYYYTADVRITYDNLNELFDQKVISKTPYKLLRNFIYYRIWKNTYYQANNEIFIKKQLYDKLYNIGNENDEEK